LSGGPDDYLVLKDGRTDLLYLRSQADLAEKGMYLSLGAYQYQVFVEMYDVHDADGRYRRLAEWLQGGGVPSLDEAMRDMELAPLHAALRHGTIEDAVHESATLLGVTAAAKHADGKRAGELTPAEAIEALVAARRPDLSHGRWLYDWRVDRVWPDADLIALQLDRDGRARPHLRALLGDDRFRRAIGVNEHDGVRYFNRERFEHAIEVLALPRGSELQRLAEQAGYRVDSLEKLLTKPRPTKPRPTKPRKLPASPRPRATKRITSRK
jgi:hypothetical protein